MLPRLFSELKAFGERTTSSSDRVTLLSTPVLYAICMLDDEAPWAICSEAQIMEMKVLHLDLKKMHIGNPFGTML